MNLVPPGTVYDQTGTWTLNVQSYSTYDIHWGANDISVNICGSIYTKAGASNPRPGQFITEVTTGGCTQMVFTGTGGSFVTLRVIAVRPPIPHPAPTGFTWTLASGLATAHWNPAPSNVVLTELWTSLNGAPFVSNGSALPGNTQIIVTGPPNVGDTLAAMIRFDFSDLAQSAFSGPLTVTNTLDAVVTSWAARVVTNGGAAPSDATKSALNDFVVGMKSDAVWSKMISVMCFAPDSLIASITPLLVGGGHDPWTNHNFLAGDLNTSGLLGDTVNKYLESGIVPNTVYPDNNSAGYTLYHACPGPSRPNGRMWVWVVNPNSDACYTDGSTCKCGLHRFDGSWDLSGNLQVAADGTFDFCSVNRVAANDLRIFDGNGNIAIAQIAFTAAASAGVRSTSDLWLNCRHSAGGPELFPSTNTRYSYAAMHLGLSLAETTLMFNRVQTLRKAFGGGWT